MTWLSAVRTAYSSCALSQKALSHFSAKTSFNYDNAKHLLLLQECRLIRKTGPSRHLRIKQTKNKNTTSKKLRLNAVREKMLRVKKVNSYQKFDIEKTVCDNVILPKNYKETNFLIILHKWLANLHWFANICFPHTLSDAVKNLLKSSCIWQRVKQLLV